MNKIVTDKKKLRRPTKIVEESTDIKEEVAALFLSLGEDADGLAANQLGYNLHIFVMRLDPQPPICIVNPVIKKVRGSQLGKERCLSLPGVELVIKRPQHITVKGLNQYYRSVKYKLSGRQARVACHEIDHLKGKLIIDISWIPAGKEVTGDY